MQFDLAIFRIASYTALVRVVPLVRALRNVLTDRRDVRPYSPSSFSASVQRG